MVVRITILLVLSYLWQHCVLETTQTVGTEFPQEACDKGADCFASDFRFSTIFNRQYENIDCEQKEEFKKRVVVSCIRIVPPEATVWLMHLAISHSIIQLNFKAFEVLVWICGNSKWSRRVIGLLIFLSLVSLTGLFFGGLLSEFASSWLSFVMSLTIPMFLYAVYKCSKRLEQLWNEEAVKVQKGIEDHLNGAFADIETVIARDSRDAGKDASSKTSDRGIDGDSGTNPVSDSGVLSKLRTLKTALSQSVTRRASRRQKGSAASSQSSCGSSVEADSDAADLSSDDAASLIKPGLANALDAAAHDADDEEEASRR